MRLGALDGRLASWHAATAAAARLAALGPAPATRADVSALRERLTGEHLALAARRGQLEAGREETQRRAVALERSGTNLDPELLRLRDELGGELLASGSRTSTSARRAGSRRGSDRSRAR